MTVRHECCHQVASLCALMSERGFFSWRDGVRRPRCFLRGKRAPLLPGRLPGRRCGHGRHELTDTAQRAVRIVPVQGALHAQYRDAVGERPRSRG
jgi:hypothetical protein